MLWIKAIKGFCSGVDLLNEWTCKIFSWLVVPLMLIVFFDVTLRYVFNSPTIWAWDINLQLLGGLTALGAGYALLTNAHIGVDIIVEQLSSRKRVMVEFIIYLLFIFSVGVFLWQTTLGVWESVLIGERYGSYWSPPVYPVKIAMFLGVLLLWLQGITKFLRSILIIKEGGKP